MVLIWLIKVVFYKMFLLLLLLLLSLYVKMGDSTDLTYYQKSKNVILNRAKDYKNDKERLREQTRDKYRNLSEEEKN